MLQNDPLPTAARLCVVGNVVENNLNELQLGRCNRLLNVVIYLFRLQDVIDLKLA